MYFTYHQGLFLEENFLTCFSLIFPIDHSHTQNIFQNISVELPILKPELPSTKTWGHSYPNLSAEGIGAGSSGNPYFLKKTKKTLSAKLPYRACHCTDYGVVHYVISYYCIQNSQINSSPRSSKHPDRLGVMAVKESRGDRQHCSKSSLSIF